MNNQYGVFCMAMSMKDEDQTTRQMDVWWDKAIELYDEFVNSSFNDPYQSELDCIQRFMADKAKYEHYI